MQLSKYQAKIAKTLQKLPEESVTNMQLPENHTNIAKTMQKTPENIMQRL